MVVVGAVTAGHSSDAGTHVSLSDNFGIDCDTDVPLIHVACNTWMLSCVCVRATEWSIKSKSEAIAPRRRWNYNVGNVVLGTKF